MNRWVSQMVAFTDQQSLANLMTTTMAKSVREVRWALPNWLSTSMMAYDMAFAVSAGDAPFDTTTMSWCQFFVGAASDSTNADTVCGTDVANPTFDFTDVDTLQQFVNGTWYGAEMYQDVQDTLVLDASQATAFYDPDTVNSFGNWLKDAIVAIWNKYECKEEPLHIDGGESQYVNNCTSWFLAQEQWGNSKITTDPPVSGNEIATKYFPTKDTTGKTGLSLTEWNLKGIGPVAPEYYFYSSTYTAYDTYESPMLTPDQVGNLTSTQYQYMGMNNTYNAKAIYYAYSMTDVNMETANIPAVLTNAMMQFGFDSLPKFYAFLNTAAGQIQQYFLGGYLQQYTITELVYGW